MSVAVEIAGVGIHPFGRFGDKTVTAMGVEAVKAALRDAGVERGGFQAAFCGTVYSGVAAGHKVLNASGSTIELESTRYPFCFYGDPSKPSSTRGVVEFVATVAAYNMVSRLLVALNVEH
mgnify:CR=1 FL=1